MTKKECNHFLFFVDLFSGQELCFNFQLIFLLFFFYDISYFSFISNSIDKLNSKQHSVSQELVCSCFAIKKNKEVFFARSVHGTINQIHVHNAIVMFTFRIHSY